MNPEVSPAAWPWPDSLDALVAAPNQHILRFENDRVRVLETVIQPGHTVPLHTHRWPAIYQVSGWSAFVRRDAEGNVLFDSRSRPAPALPCFMWSEPLPPHTLENVGQTPIELVSFEIKG